MAPRYLLDTDTCIYLRQRRSENVMRHFARLDPGEAAISVVTYGELFYGVEKSAQSRVSFDRLVELTTVLPVLPLTFETARAYGSIRADLERSGRLIGGNDLWIAAHAQAEGLTLVTNNQKEFRRVRGLKLQNWVNQAG
jgi:tRNA(fMet)-specific endonuclease VapC